MKRTIAFAALVGALTFSGAAYADLADYLSNPGRQQAIEVGAQCGSGAGSGGFEFQRGPGANQKGGADGQATGANNAALCGNKDGTKHVP